MESIIKTPEEKQEELKYPCLKVFHVDDKLVVLFTSICTGTAITGKRLGEHRNDWVEDSFNSFNGEITLKN